MTYKKNISPLKDLAKFKYGKFLSKANLDKSGYPVFSGYGIVGYLPTYEYSEKQLLIVCRGEGGTGDVKLSPSKCSITNLSIVITPYENIITKKFLYWALKTIDTYKLRTGSAQAQITIEALNNLVVEYPFSISYQNQITKILDYYDGRIDLLKQTNKTLESIAQAIFKSWFVDFDPVHAKQQGVECAGIDKATADLFPDSFEESEQGWIPTGWTIKQLKDIAVRHVEKIKNVVDWENEYLIDLSRIDSKTLFNINNGFGKELTTSVTKFVKGDILFGAIRPYFHKVTIANLNGVTNISVFVIRPSVDFYHEYLASLMFRESTVDFSVRLSKGTKMPVISWSDLSTLKITLAPESIIKKYSEIISPLIKKGIENSALINSLTSTRDALLPRLISGKINLSNIEDELEGIA
jgi:type I restriction enzyme S subunit